MIWKSLLYDCLLTDWKTTLKSNYYYRRCIFSSIYSYKSFVCLVSIKDKDVYIENYTNGRVTVTMWENWPPVYVCLIHELTDVITDLRNTLLKQKKIFPINVWIHSIMFLNEAWNDSNKQYKQNTQILFSLATWEVSQRAAQSQPGRCDWSAECAHSSMPPDPNSYFVEFRVSSALDLYVFFGTFEFEHCSLPTHFMK